MSYPEMGVDGEPNPCFFLMRELEHCYNRELYTNTKCKNVQDDFFECHNRGKQIKLMSALNYHLKRAELIRVPHYDAKNDSFVYDDGKVVSNTDPIFNRFKWA